MALMVLGTGLVSYGYFPALLEIKRGGLFTDRQCGKRA